MEEKSLGLTGWLKDVANFSATVIIAGLLVWLIAKESPRLHDKFAGELERSRDKFSSDLETLRKHDEASREKLGDAIIANCKATDALTNELRTTRHSKQK